MTTDNRYNTVSMYSPNTDRYPDHQVSFVDKHKQYLIDHIVDAEQYVANLRLMTRK